MIPVAALVIGLAVVVAAAQAPGAVQTELPPECRERDVNPEKCVIKDGPAPKPIVRKKQPPPPPAVPKAPAKQVSSGSKDGGARP
jgi:hypothetical protein